MSDCSVLPPGVWQNVSSHLQLADWARACGACREMFHLPLNTLNISEKVPIEGLVWASKRWGKAARLRIEYAEASALAVAGVIIRGVADLDALQELALECPKSASLPRREAACMWLGALLARANALRVLSLAINDLPSLPTLARLQHLKLTVYDGAAADVVTSLPQLGQLVTFAMAYSGADGVALEMPALALAGLAHLRYVGLSGVQPASVSLPGACKLELKNCGACSTDVWQAVAGNIGCISISNGGLFIEVEVPRIMQLPCANLQLLHLHLGCLGQSCLPVDLPAGLLRVKWVCISTKKGLHLNVAGEVRCEDISLNAHGSLSLNFDAAATASFLSCAPKFQFSWRKCYGDGFIKLLAQLAASGVRLDIRSMHGFSTVSSPPRAVHAACGCGTCYTCAMAVLPKYEWTHALCAPYPR